MAGAFFLFYGGTLQPFFAAPATYGGAETAGFGAALGALPIPSRVKKLN